MNKTMLMAALLAAVGLAACDRPAVIAVPVGVAGPAGPAGATGATGGTGSPGYDGVKGDTGKAGTDTTVIVLPPAASAPN